MHKWTWAGLLGGLALTIGGSVAADDKAGNDGIEVKELPTKTVNDWLTPWLRHEQFRNAKISPGGEYIAASVLATEDTGALVVLRRSDMKPTANIRVRGKTVINDFDWVNNTRLVYSIAKSEGSIGSPKANGELNAIDFDGKNQLNFGGGADTSDAAGGNKDYVLVDLVDTLLDDDKYILVQTSRATAGEAQYPQLERVDVYSGARKVVAKSPLLFGSFTTDVKGVARFVSGQGKDRDNKNLLYYRNSSDGDWQTVNDEHETGISISAVGFTKDGKHAYLEAEEAEGPNAIYEWDPATKTKTLLAKDDRVDPLRLVYSFDGSHPVAIAYLDGGPKYAVLDAEAREVGIMKNLMASFPGSAVRITSVTKDGQELVFRVSSDREPGRYYLLDKSGKATYLFANRDWIKADDMAEMQPITLNARDGLRLDGYLTLPKGSSGKNLPMIVHPHGGPFGPYDAWGFNRDVQMMASRGYAVLQVNFRGSGNYGRAFTHLGDQQWGGTMQDDLTDATLWAIKEGYADKNRICIYGASYGGYASAMGIAKEPDLYKCAVGYVGVYDMGLMYSRGDIQQRSTGVNFLKDRLGKGAEKLGEASPTKLADRMKAPIFIVCGGEDVRAHCDHSRALRASLQAVGKEPEWMLAPHEGHGFYREDVNRELYTRMFAFFDKYIGAGAK